MTSARSNTPAKGHGGNGGSNNMLLDLIDRVLDKGVVIDAWARVSVLSIELLTIEARVVVASVDTYLRYAEAIGNTALASAPRPQQAQQPQQTQQPQQAQVPQQAPALPQPQQQNGMPQWQAQPQQTQQPQTQQQNGMPHWQGQPQQTQQPQPNQ